MSTRFTIAALIYGMVTAVLFGGGSILVLSVPALAAQAMWLLPAIVGASVLVAGPIAWWLAPRLRLRSRHDSRVRHQDEAGHWIPRHPAERGA